MRGFQRTAKHLLAVVAVVLPAGMALTTTAAQASTASAGSFVTMTSESGDYIGGGAAREWWAPGGGTITVSGTTTELDLSVSGGPSGSSFTYDIAAPSGQSLNVGEYDNAERTPFRSTGHPGIDIYGDGRGCNTTTGSFTVRDVAFAAGVVSRLDMSYEEHCEGGTAALFGQLSINEPTADPSVLVMPTTIAFPSAYPGTDSAVARVRVVNTGSVPLHPAALALTGYDSDQFIIRADNCAGTTVAAGSSCLDDLRFTPSSDRAAAAHATAVESDDSAGSPHNISLAGSIQPGHTSWEMTGDSGDYIVGSNHYDWTPADANISASGNDSHVSFALTSGSHWWYANFSASQGDILAPGDYTGAVRDAFRGNAAGIDVSGDGRGCNTITGSFHVYQYLLDPDSNALQAVSLTWEQHCEGGTAAAYGSIAWHATDPAQPVPTSGSSGPPDPGTDTTPPGPVQGLAVTGEPEGAVLSWSNPTDADLGRIIVRGKLGLTPPASVTDGDAVYSGTADIVHTDAHPQGTAYTFGVWAEDSAGNLSPARSVTLRATTVSVHAPSVVTYRSDFPLSIWVRDASTGDGIGHVPVDIYVRAPIGGDWTKVDSATTGADGHATVTGGLDGPVSLEAVYDGGSGRAADDSATRAIAVAPRVTGYYRATVPAGGTEVIHGRVAPNLAGHKIRLQRLEGGSWRTVRSATLSDTNRFRWSFSLSRRGKVAFRLLVPAVGDFVEERTPGFTVQVT